MKIKEFLEKFNMATAVKNGTRADCHHLERRHILWVKRFRYHYSEVRLDTTLSLSSVAGSRPNR